MYNANGTLVDETARCRVVKIKTGVYTWRIEGGSASSSEAEGIISGDDYNVIRAEISGREKAGVPIAWAVNSAGDFYIVAVCGDKVIDGMSDANFSYDAAEKVLWITSPFEDADFWLAYIYRNELPANNFSIAEGRAKISAIQAQFEKDNRVMRQLVERRFRNLRTPDTLKTLPPAPQRAGMVLGFDNEGNPDLSLSKGDVSGAYRARDESLAAAKSASESGKSALESASKAAAAEEAVKKSEQTVLEAERRVIGTVEGEIGEINKAKEDAISEIESISDSLFEAQENVLEAAERAANSEKAAISANTSAQAAKTAAENASSSASAAKSTAESAAANATNAKIAAETAASNAANSKAAAETARTGAENAQAAAEAAKASIDDKLVQLQGRTAGVGEFFFDSGKLVGQGPSPIQSLPFSFCFTAPRGLRFVNNTRILRSGLEDSGNCAYIWMANASNPAFVVTLRSGNAQIRNVAYDFSPYADAFHTFVITVSDKLDSNNYLEVHAYVDGEEIAKRSDSGTANPPADISTTEPLNIGSTNSNTPLMQGTLSRVKIFNFDMSAAGAPYTIEEYAADMDESPVLRQCPPGKYFENDPEKFTGLDPWGSGTIAYDGTDIVISGFNTETYGRFSLKFPQKMKAGSRVRVKVRFESANSATYQLFLYETSSQRLRIGDAHDGEDFEWEGVCPYNATIFYVQAIATWQEAEYRVISSSIEVLGPVLTLADSADSAIVRDLSGNENHMTLSGIAVPSKLNNPALAPQKISWAGTATAQNVCGDNGAPADSIVTIYAYPSSALTLKTKTATHAEISTNLPANSWTLISTRTVPTTGAIVATPSAAFTGSVEFSVKIERLK